MKDEELRTRNKELKKKTDFALPSVALTAFLVVNSSFFTDPPTDY
jgi:hypothetical protein